MFSYLLLCKGGRLINNEDMIMLMNVLSALIISPSFSHVRDCCVESEMYNVLVVNCRKLPYESSPVNCSVKRKFAKDDKVYYSYF